MRRQSSRIAALLQADARPIQLAQVCLHCAKPGARQLELQITLAPQISTFQRVFWGQKVDVTASWTHSIRISFWPAVTFLTDRVTRHARMR